MIKFKIVIIVILALAISSCTVNTNTNDPNLLLLIYNGMVDSTSTHITIKIDDQLVCDGFVNRYNIPDKYNIYKYYLNPKEDHKIIVTVPKHDVQEKLEFNFEGNLAIGVNLHYEPIDDEYSSQGVSFLTEPSVSLKMLKNNNLEEYESIDHEIIN